MDIGEAGRFGECGYTATYISLIDLFFNATIKGNNEALVKPKRYNCDIDNVVIIMA